MLMKQGKPELPQLAPSALNSAAVTLTDTHAHCGPQGAPVAVLDGILGLTRFELNHTCSGVYFLLQGDRIVYVGQSTRVIFRVSGHFAIGVKKFDGIAYIPVPIPDLDFVELLYINALCPLFNKSKVVPMLPKVKDEEKLRLLKYIPADLAAKGYCARRRPHNRNNKPCPFCGLGGAK